MPLAKKADRKYTYEDYAGWPSDERWELINGEAYDMTPAPTIRHQKVLANLHILVSGHPQRKKECFVGIAPIDVLFSESDVVQPDLIVVCDTAKITETHIRGAPDLVIEILSESTARKDKREKKALYEKYGVPEYLIVEPSARYAERFLLNENGRYDAGEVFGPEDVLPLIVMGGIKIQLKDVFEL